MANSVNHDQTAYSVASDLGLLCLLKSVCPKNYAAVYIFYNVIVLPGALLRRNKFANFCFHSMQNPLS